MLHFSILTFRNRHRVKVEEHEDIIELSSDSDSDELSQSRAEKTTRKRTLSATDSQNIPKKMRLTVKRKEVIEVLDSDDEQPMGKCLY